MWIGLNTLEVNEATMIAAFQFWLDNKILNKIEESPIVTQVKADTGKNTFRIELKGPSNAKVD